MIDDILDIDNRINHKGFYGTICYSSEDDILYGRIVDVKASVSYHGDTLEEVKTAFIEAVEDLINYCEENGYDPHLGYDTTKAQAI